MLRTAYGYETVAIQMASSAIQEVTPSSGKYLNSAVHRRDDLVDFVHEAEMDNEKSGVQVPARPPARRVQRVRDLNQASRGTVCHIRRRKYRQALSM
jgi:hypothetical protein